MARFRFALDALLRLRETQEERERELLDAIARQIQLSEESLLQNGNERQQIRKDTLRRLSIGVVAEEIGFIEMSSAAVARLGQTILAELEALRGDWHRQHEKYLQARKDSEVLRNLRNRQHAAFVLTQKRIEQQEADDLYNLRAARSKP